VKHSLLSAKNSERLIYPWLEMMDGASITTVGANAAPFMPNVLIFVASVSWEHCLTSPQMNWIHLLFPVADNKFAPPMADGVA
jgi:hypothetical protein